MPVHIVDSHEFIEMYRGDKDLRLGIELCRNYGYKYTMLVPDVASPNDRRFFRTKKFPMKEAKKYDWPEGFQIKTVPGCVLDFSTITPSSIFAMVIAPGIARELKNERPDLLYESIFTTLTPRSYLNFLSEPELPRVYVDPADSVKKGSFRRFLNKFERQVINSAKAIFTYSDMGKTRFIRDYSTTPENIHVLPKPMDVKLFNPNLNGEDIAKKYGLDGRTVVTYVGRFSRSKGVDSLYSVAKIYKKNASDVTFLFVGDGDVRPGPETQSNCVFTGNLDHSLINKILAVSDILVFPDFTKPPAFTTILAESMAMGKPIIVGLGGYESAMPIEHMKSGIIIQARDVGAIKDWIDRLVEDVRLRKELGGNARRFAEEFMDWRKQVKMYKEIFERAVKE